MGTYNEILNAWQKENISDDVRLAAILDNQKIALAYHSGKIENDAITYNDTREIFEHDGVTSYTGDLRTLFEIKNAKNAHELFLDTFAKRRPIDFELVKDFQRTLTQSTYDTRRWQLGERPGEFKHHDYVTGRDEVGAHPDDVEEELGELLNELYEIPNEKALTAAAYFHSKFENIHPFAEGNGRTGRLLMNYFLVTHNHPPIIIHEEDKQKYYAALESWDKEQKLEPLRSFLQEQTEKTWERWLQRNHGRNGKHSPSAEDMSTFLIKKAEELKTKAENATVLSAGERALCDSAAEELKTLCEDAISDMSLLNKLKNSENPYVKRAAREIEQAQNRFSRTSTDA